MQIRDQLVLRTFRVAFALATVGVVTVGCTDGAATSSNPGSDSASATLRSTGDVVSGESSEKENPYEDKALARIAVDMLVNALERSQSVQSYLSDSLLTKVHGMSEAEVQAYLKNMIFRDGMAPNLSSRKFAVDLNRGSESYIKSVAYYDRDIRPGVNRENVRIDLTFENGAWHVDRWTREG